MTSAFETASELLRDEIPQLCERCDWERALEACRRAQDALNEAVREDAENEGLLDDPWALAATAALGQGRIDVAGDALRCAHWKQPWLREHLLAVVRSLEPAGISRAAVLLDVLLQERHFFIEWWPLFNALAGRLSEHLAQLDEPMSPAVARYLVDAASGTPPSADEEPGVRQTLARWAERGIQQDESAAMQAGFAVACSWIPGREREVAQQAWSAIHRGWSFKLVFELAHGAYLRAAREADAERILEENPAYRRLAEEQLKRVQRDRLSHGAERSDDDAAARMVGGALTPRFLTRVGVVAAGSAFCATVGTRKLLVTARHLLGADGKVSFRFDEHELSAPVVGVQLVDAFSGEVLGYAESPPSGALRTTGEAPPSDCVCFPIREGSAEGLHFLELDAHGPADGQPAFVIGAERESQFFTRWRHRGKVRRRQGELIEIELANLSLNCAGLSGAPVVGTDGRVLGMVVRGPHHGVLTCISSAQLEALAAS